MVAAPSFRTAPLSNLRLALGNKVVTDDKAHWKHRVPTDPTFCMPLKVKVALPGAAGVTLRVVSHRETVSMDNERIVSTTDDLLGETVIDVEQRWFNDEWRALATKPLEHRALWHPRAKTPVGCVSPSPSPACRRRAPRRRRHTMVTAGWRVCHAPRHAHHFT